MASTPVSTPDYSTPGKGGFTEPLDESRRWVENKELHFVPEWEQSGRLPPNQTDVPDGAPGNARPFKPF
jgi:hypothetical protein